jgi:hypothetical protein
MKASRSALSWSLWVVARPCQAWLERPWPAAVVGDAPGALRRQEDHLVLPGIGAQRPAMAEDHRLSPAPVLVVDLGAVGRGEPSHGKFSPVVTVRLRRRRRCAAGQRDDRQAHGHRHVRAANEDVAAKCNRTRGCVQPVHRGLPVTGLLEGRRAPFFFRSITIRSSARRAALSEANLSKSLQRGERRVPGGTHERGSAQEALRQVSSSMSRFAALRSAVPNPSVNW